MIKILGTQKYPRLTTAGGRVELENHCFSTSVSKSLFIDKFIQVQTDDNVCYVVKIHRRRKV